MSKALPVTRCVYRAYLWHPDCRWYRLSLSSLSYLQYGEGEARIAEFAGSRVRIARGIATRTGGLDAALVVRLLRGQILRFDAQGALIRSDMVRRMQGLSDLLEEPGGARGGPGARVVDARARFALASLEWTPEPSVREFLLQAICGHVVLPEYVAFADIEAVAGRADPQLP